MNKFCVGCGGEIHPKRVEILPYTKTCVGCSTTEKKGGMTVQLGEGDHTYNEIIIMDRDDLNKIEDLQNRHKKVIDGSHKAEMLNDEDEDAPSSSTTIDDSGDF
jgi:hypothetical protein